MSTHNPSILVSLQRIASGLGALPADVPQPAHVPPEELIVRYTIGTGTFSADKRFFSAKGDMFLPDGKEDGHWEGVHELVVPLSAAWQTPPPPPPPFNIPVPPVPEPPPQVYTKGTWTFRDRGSLTAVGQALIHAAKFQTADTDLWISANQLISNGSGQFEGAQGLKIAGISILVPSDKTLEALKETDTVVVKTIEVFRVARREYIGKPPPLLLGG
jgi:hypothetical protein